MTHINDDMLAVVGPHINDGLAAFFKGGTTQFPFFFTIGQSVPGDNESSHGYDSGAGYGAISDSTPYGFGLNSMYCFAGSTNVNNRMSLSGRPAGEQLVYLDVEGYGSVNFVRANNTSPTYSHTDNAFGTFLRSQLGNNVPFNIRLPVKPPAVPGYLNSMRIGTNSAVTKYGYNVSSGTAENFGMIQKYLIADGVSVLQFEAALNDARCAIKFSAAVAGASVTVAFEGYSATTLEFTNTGDNLTFTRADSGFVNYLASLVGEVKGFTAVSAVGPELIVNGDFLTDISGWSASGGSSQVVTWESAGLARIARIDSVNAGTHNMIQDTGNRFAMEEGAEYLMGAECLAYNIGTSGPFARINVNLLGFAYDGPVFNPGTPWSAVVTAGAAWDSCGIYIQRNGVSQTDVGATTDIGYVTLRKIFRVEAL